MQEAWDHDATVVDTEKFVEAVAAEATFGIVTNRGCIIIKNAMKRLIV
jgi:hypothetical protein